MWTNTIWTQRFEKITPKWTNVSWKGTILKGKNVIFQPKASNGIRQFSGGVINCRLKSNVPSSRKTKIICLQHFLPSRKAVVSSQSQCYHHCQSSLSDPAQKARSLLSICQTVWYIYMYIYTTLLPLANVTLPGLDTQTVWCFLSNVDPWNHPTTILQRREIFRGLSASKLPEKWKNNLQPNNH